MLPRQSIDMLRVFELLRKAAELRATDLHISPYSPPFIRVDGVLLPLDERKLSPQETKEFCLEVIPDWKRRRFEEDSGVDFALSVEGVGRVRCSVYLDRGNVAGAFRILPSKIMTLDEIGLPENVITRLIRKPKGLILVTGATGSGKTTTLACMIDMINSEKPVHIVTIEDPIEYTHSPKKALITQREVGSDVPSFLVGLKQALRQDPDVILVGEMRDLETIETALIATETGHIVFSTLHTSTALETVNRIIDVFPPHQQVQIRAVLSMVLEGVICQMLLPRAHKPGRILAYEIMISTPAIRNLIRDGKVHQIYSAIQTGRERTGMITMNMKLAELVARGEISIETAFDVSPDKEEIERLLKR